jgi:hypothetical protein
MKKVIDISKESARRAISRQNSLKSTGPVTEAGKAASSQNARKHGLCSFAILQDEDPQAYVNFRASLLREYRPATPTESALVENIAQSQWLLNRVQRREAVAMAADPLMTAIETFKLFQRYAAGYRRAFAKDIETLRRFQAERPKDQSVTASSSFVSQPFFTLDPPPPVSEKTPQVPLPGSASGPGIDRDDPPIVA